jgi:hypothetical protein
MRQELGRQLRGLRQAARLSQQQVARRTGYTRSAVSNAESGGHARRRFWELCDEVFGTNPMLASGYDQIHARPPAVTSRGGPGGDDGVPGLELLHAAREPGALGRALAGFQKLGWPAEEHQGRLVLATGTVIDALEVPRPAGMLAARWWLFTGGAADQVRGLPALPRPDQALAVIQAAASLFFLARSDGAGHPQAGGETLGSEPGVIGWHGLGSHIPAPPSPGPGPEVSWAYLPSARLRLAPAIGLLDLLAKAVATAGPGTGRLVFPGGVLVLPACRPPG